MNKPILAACLLLPITAHASPWYVFNYAQDRCEQVSAAHSPNALIEAFRSDGNVPTIQVFRNDDNSIKAVEILVGKPSVELDYFTAIAHCEEFKLYEETKGVVASPSELR